MKEHTLLWVGVAILAVLLLVPFVSGFGWGAPWGLWGPGPMMGPWMMGRWGPWNAPGWGSWSSPWAILIAAFPTLLLLIGAAVLVVYVLRSRAAADESPLAILRRRYAAGEISREQFDAFRRDLGVERSVRLNTCSSDREGRMVPRGGVARAMEVPATNSWDATRYSLPILTPLLPRAALERKFS